jgi:hypothetical protein
MSTSQTQAQRLEALKRTHAALITRLANVKARVEEAQRTLSQVQTEAQMEFGTDDIAKLRELHAQHTQDNESKLTVLASALSTAEQQLADIERQLAA